MVTHTCIFSVVTIHVARIIIVPMVWFRSIIPVTPAAPEKLNSINSHCFSKSTWVHISEHLQAAQCSTLLIIISWWRGGFWRNIGANWTRRCSYTSEGLALSWVAGVPNLDSWLCTPVTFFSGLLGELVEVPFTMVLLSVEVFAAFLVLWSLGQTQSYALLDFPWFPIHVIVKVSIAFGDITPVLTFA